jgi:hypothetical protein
MKLYIDKNLEQEIQSLLDLGTVEAGENKQFTFYCYNDTLAELIDLIFEINSKEIKILSAPKILSPKGVGEITIEYSPEITIKSGLKALLNVNGKELYK